MFLRRQRGYRKYSFIRDSSGLLTNHLFDFGQESFLHILHFDIHICLYNKDFAFDLGFMKTLAIRIFFSVCSQTFLAGRKIANFTDVICNLDSIIKTTQKQQDYEL